MLRISHAHQRRFWSIVANWVSKALTVSKSAHDDQWWDLVILVIFCLNLWKTEAPLGVVITGVHKAVTVAVVTVGVLTFMLCAGSVTWQGGLV